MSATPEPGPDEIVLSAPAARDLCQSLEHLRAGRPAQVRVTFGELGTLFADDLWPECWHHSYPMCGQCWRATHRAAAQRRPALVIRGATSQPASTSNGRPLTGGGPGWGGDRLDPPGGRRCPPGDSPRAARAARPRRRPWPRGHHPCAVGLGLGAGGYGYLVATVTGGELAAAAVLARRPWRAPLPESSGTPDPPSPGRRSAHGSARYSVHGHSCIVRGCTVEGESNPERCPPRHQEGRICRRPLGFVLASPHRLPAPEDRERGGR